MDILQIKNLNLGFNSELGFLQVLHDVSLNLQEGKTLAIVGESGCGKTLTAMSILNLLPENCEIKSGEILFENRNLLNLSLKDMTKVRGAKIALIPQDPMTSLNPLYTIENQMIEGILIHRNCDKKEAQKIVLDALDMVRIPNAKDRLKNYPHELSGGMKQRIIIAMALCAQAKVIIADEPTTALDVTVQAQILELLNQLQKELNTSIIMITHDLGVVKENADDICIMYAGHIVESANCDDLFNNPKHPYTQALLNSVPKSDTKFLKNIKGAPPRLGVKIDGCVFNPRCEKVFDDCKIKYPDLKCFENSHCVACHLY
ncbi:ABC transporter ATP-binding protein [bacterium]|nr:ABC transporter ATP-binding protein [bacterium]